MVGATLAVEVMELLTTSWGQVSAEQRRRDCVRQIRAAFFAAETAAAGLDALVALDDDRFERAMAAFAHAGEDAA